MSSQTAPARSFRSRQKSCIPCAEGKRRCNRQTPQCSRCLARGVHCSYISGTTRPRQNKEKHSTSANHNERGIHNSLTQYPQLDPPSSEYLDALGLSDLWMTVSPSSLIFPPSLSETLYPDIAFLDKWSTSQLLQNIKDFPRMFAQHRRTPFIHPRLYESHLPDAIQDAFSISASYCMKSPETEDMVFHILEAKSASLVQQDHQAMPLEDLLAAVQALMLFHIIQLFDGNIRQRSTAEQNLGIMRSWTMELHMRANALGSTPTWEAWIFSESVRRTVILSTMIEQIYSVLKVGYCTSIAILRTFPFTCETGLWEASSSHSWLSDLYRLGSTMVLYGDYSQEWGKGKVRRQLNYFQKLLLTPCMGETHREILEIRD